MVRYAKNIEKYRVISIDIVRNPQNATMNNNRYNRYYNTNKIQIIYNSPSGLCI